MATSWCPIDRILNELKLLCWHKKCFHFLTHQMFEISLISIQQVFEFWFALFAAPSTGYKIRVHILSIDTECFWDRLYFYDGRSFSDKLIGVFSGQNKSRDVYASSGDVSTYWRMWIFGIIFILWEFLNDAYTIISQILIGCSLVSEEYTKLIGRYRKTVRRQLYTLTCPITLFILLLILGISIETR